MYTADDCLDHPEPWYRPQITKALQESERLCIRSNFGKSPSSPRSMACYHDSLVLQSSAESTPSYTQLLQRRGENRDIYVDLHQKVYISRWVSRRPTSPVGSHQHHLPRNPCLEVWLESSFPQRLLSAQIMVLRHRFLHLSGKQLHRGIAERSRSRAV